MKQSLLRYGFQVSFSTKSHSESLCFDVEFVSKFGSTLFPCSKLQLRLQTSAKHRVQLHKKATTRECQSVNSFLAPPPGLDLAELFRSFVSLDVLYAFYFKQTQANLFTSIRNVQKKFTTKRLLRSVKLGPIICQHKKKKRPETHKKKWKVLSLFL